MYTVVPSGVLASGRARDQKMLHIGAIFEDVIVRATLSSDISMQSPKKTKLCIITFFVEKMHALPMQEKELKDYEYPLARKIRKTCLLSIHNSFGKINMTCR